jgi:hypothetical protein
VKELGILRPDPALAPPEERVTLPETDPVAVTHQPGAH